MLPQDYERAHWYTNFFREIRITVLQGVELDESHKPLHSFTCKGPEYTSRDTALIFENGLYYV